MPVSVWEEVPSTQCVGVRVQPNVKKRPHPPLEQPFPGRSCRCELGSARREFTSTATHQPSYLLSGVSPNFRVAFCRCELVSPPGSSHLQNARGADSRELGLCTCVIARSGDVSRLRAARPSRGAHGAAEVCGAPCAPGRHSRCQTLGRTRTPTHRDDEPQWGLPPLMGQDILASPCSHRDSNPRGHVGIRSRALRLASWAAPAESPGTTPVADRTRRSTSDPAAWQAQPQGAPVPGRGARPSLGCPCASGFSPATPSP